MSDSFPIAVAIFCIFIAVGWLVTIGLDKLIERIKHD